MVRMIYLLSTKFYHLNRVKHITHSNINFLSDIGLPPKTPTNIMPPVKRTFSNAASVPSRQHTFIQKSVKVTEKCNQCKKRIKFGKIFLKCQDCEIICHKECKLQVFTQIRVIRHMAIFNLIPVAHSTLMV